MSSTYRVLCLSHDPAVVAVDRDWQSGADGRDLAVRAALARDDLDGHEQCDLAVGSFSYPLVEVACIGCAANFHGTRARWVDADVLRLLWHAQHADDVAAAATAGSARFRCWPPDRLKSLRVFLALAGPHDAASPAAPTTDPVALDGPIDEANGAFFATCTLCPPDVARSYATFGEDEDIARGKLGRHVRSAHHVPPWPATGQP